MQQSTNDTVVQILVGLGRNMISKSRVLVDVNVVLDVLTSREPNYDVSAAVWTLVEGDAVEGVVAAHTVTTVHYLVGRHLGRQ